MHCGGAASRRRNVFRASSAAVFDYSITSCGPWGRAGLESTMSIFRRAAAAALIAIASVGILGSEAQARDGRNAALLGGAALGIIAGAAIANAADAASVQQAG